MQREHPSAGSGGPRNSDASQGRFALRLAAGLATLALGLTMTTPVWADELTDERDRVRANLTVAQAELETATTSLAHASSQLQRSRGQLTEARAALEETRRQLAQAQEQDAAAATRWAAALNELEAAKAAVAQGERHVREQQAEVGNVARTQYQQRTGLVGIGMVVNGTHTNDLSNRVQWSTTVFASVQAELDALEETQRVLEAARDKQAAIERDLAEQRAAAAAQLQRRQTLNATATEQERTVAALVQSNARAEENAAGLQAAAEDQAHALVTEQAEVEQRIAERVAAEQAEQLRRAAEERRRQEEAAIARARAEAEAARARGQEQAAREAEERERAAREAAAQAESEPQAAAAATSERESGAEADADAGHGFLRPVDGRITSRYGMRLHPVLKVWKLHDGTDFGVGCSTVIRAAYDGVVTERYYNAGYGNRLMIDHGRVDGRYVTTGYNHATHYVVRVGERVKRGEVIGYVGSTGYSTGCHLHLMVWLNGKVSNPEAWFSF